MLAFYFGRCFGSSTPGQESLPFPLIVCLGKLHVLRAHHQEVNAQQVSDAHPCAAAVVIVQKCS